MGLGNGSGLSVTEPTAGDLGLATVATSGSYNDLSNKPITSTSPAIGDILGYNGSAYTNRSNPSGIDIRDYGAVCDGTTDDTTAINSALTAAGTIANTVAGGSVVVIFPAGKTSRITDRLLPPASNIRIEMWGHTIAVDNASITEVFYDDMSWSRNDAISSVTNTATETIDGTSRTTATTAFADSTAAANWAIGELGKIVSWNPMSDSTDPDHREGCWFTVIKVNATDMEVTRLAGTFTSGVRVVRPNDYTFELAGGTIRYDPAQVRAADVDKQCLEIRRRRRVKIEGTKFRYCSGIAIHLIGVAEWNVTGCSAFHLFDQSFDLVANDGNYAGNQVDAFGYLVSDSGCGIGTFHGNTGFWLRHMYTSNPQSLTCSVNFAAQSGGNFATNDVITGGTSGATATLTSQTDSGTTGTLNFTTTSGNFRPGETISNGGAVSATVSSLTFTSQATSIATGNTITGGTSGATATIASQVDLGSHGTLTLSGITGIFTIGETITGSGGGSAVVAGAFVVSNSTDPMFAGGTDGITVTGNTAMGMVSTAFDTHAGTRAVTMTGNVAKHCLGPAYAFRGNGVVSGNTAYNCGKAAQIFAAGTSAPKVIVSGNHFEKCGSFEILSGAVAVMGANNFVGVQDGATTSELLRVKTGARCEVAGENTLWVTSNGNQALVIEPSSDCIDAGGAFRFKRQGWTSSGPVAITLQRSSTNTGNVSAKFIIEGPGWGTLPDTSSASGMIHNTMGMQVWHDPAMSIGQGKGWGPGVRFRALWNNAVTINRNVREITAAGDVITSSSDDIVVLNKTSGAATTVYTPYFGLRGALLRYKDQKLDAASNNITVIPEPLNAISFDGQTANFQVGAKVTGGTSSATSVIIGQTDSGSTGTLYLAELVRQLSFDGQTGGFANAERVTGDSSGATGIISSQQDNGTAGVLYLRCVAGNFIDDETIRGNFSGVAVVNGTLSNSFQDNETITCSSGGSATVNGANNFLYMDFTAQTANFTGTTITGGTSGATGAFISQTDAGTTGQLGLATIAGNFRAGETITGSTAGSAKVATLKYSAASGNFTDTETITGGTSGATATISSQVDYGNFGRLTLSSITGVFAIGETITGGTSASTAKAGGSLYCPSGLVDGADKLTISTNGASYELVNIGTAWSVQ